MQEAIERGRALLREARRVVVLTGAGISAESGVPTFRGGASPEAVGPDGEPPLWTRFRPEELATPEAFARDPRLVWEWYGWRRALVGRCSPNAAHAALARLATDPARATLVTQNIDGLHIRAWQDAAEAAGHAPEPAARPIELHGCLFRVRCTRCDHAADHTGPIDAAARATLPSCPECGALARPAVVWFGEALDAADLGRAFAAAEEADACLVVGTSGAVYPAAGVAAVTARHGRPVIEVNPEPTALTELCAISLRARATTAVPALLAEASPPAPPSA